MPTFEKCSICDEDLDNVSGPGSTNDENAVVKGCNAAHSHLFHRICLGEWCNRGNTTCPLCRMPVDCNQRINVDNPVSDEILAGRGTAGGKRRKTRRRKTRRRKTRRRKTSRRKTSRRR